jgi:hypothetical protein
MRLIEELICLWMMTTENDPARALRTLGFRASAEAIRALVTHATRSNTPGS